MTWPPRPIVRASRTVPCSPWAPRRLGVMPVPTQGRCLGAAPSGRLRRARGRRGCDFGCRCRAGHAGARRGRLACPLHHRFRDFLYDFFSASGEFALARTAPRLRLTQSSFRAQGRKMFARAMKHTWASGASAMSPSVRLSETAPSASDCGLRSQSGLRKVSKPKFLSSRLNPMRPAAVAGKVLILPCVRARPD